MMMVREFGRQAAKCAIYGGERRCVPVANQRMNIGVCLLSVGNFGFDLGPEIVGVSLVSVMTVILN